MNAVVLYRPSLEPQSYVRQANSKNWFFDWAFRQVERRREKYEDNFYLLLYADPEEADDFFIIHYGVVAHLLTKENLSYSGDKYPKVRWIGDIVGGRLSIKRSSNDIDVSQCYANHRLLNCAMDGFLPEDW
jgi:hypothetical protein